MLFLDLKRIWIIIFICNNIFFQINVKGKAGNKVAIIDHSYSSEQVIYIGRDSEKFEEVKMDVYL